STLLAPYTARRSRYSQGKLSLGSRRAICIRGKTMKSIIVTATIAGVVLAASTASSQLLKTQPKAPAPQAKAPAAAPAPAQGSGPLILCAAGVATCAQWLSGRQTPAGQTEGTAWVAGFLSGVNYTGIDPSHNVTGGANAQAIANGLDQGCRASPSAR